MRIDDDYLLYVACRALAERRGYDVQETGSGKARFGFVKPGVPGAFGIYETSQMAWVEAARSYLEDAAIAGIEREALAQ